MDFQLRFIDKMRINTSLQLEFQMNNQRKLIQLFKTFNERILIPQLSRTNGSLIQWNKFSLLLSNETVTIDDLQAYVDSISAVPEKPLYSERNGLALKKKTDPIDTAKVTLPSENNAFNPSKTFGGEKARPKFPVKNEFDDFTKREEVNQNPLNFGGRDDGQSRRSNPQIILQELDRMGNLFVENHKRIYQFLFYKQPQPQPQSSERMVFQERPHIERGSERFMSSPGEQRQMERNNEMPSNNVERLTSNSNLSNFERPIERLNIERQNIERQNIERLNIERQNIERQNIERQNIERQNIERQNIERQNIERQNIERQNIERQNMMTNMSFDRPNMAPPSKYL